FSPSPGGRHEEDGDFNGEKFRRSLLVPALKTGDQVQVLIDGTSGYGSSFLEEAFGGLVRWEGFTADALKRVLNIVTSAPGFAFYKTRIWNFINDARPEHRPH